jgi:hypothetical protein
MWTHTRMSFSSEIFTSLPPVHTQNPDFLGRQLWLCFFASSWISPCRTSELDSRQIPESAALRGLRLRQLEVPGFCVFVTPRLPRTKIPEIRMFANLKLRRSLIPENREFLVPEKHISRTLSNSTFLGWRVFLNSPTLAPRGSGLTPTIRFHEYFGNFVKKRHPRNVGGDTRRPETLQRSDRGRFRGTTAPVPINRRLPLLKFFYGLLLLLRFVTLSVRGTSSFA